MFLLPNKSIQRQWMLFYNLLLPTLLHDSLYDLPKWYTGKAGNLVLLYFVAI